jgi:hypothetical protein
VKGGKIVSLLDTIAVILDPDRTSAEGIRQASIDAPQEGDVQMRLAAIKAILDSCLLAELLDEPPTR